jgi:hypothetical protein
MGYYYNTGNIRDSLNQTARTCYLRPNLRGIGFSGFPFSLNEKPSTAAAKD